LRLIDEESLQALEGSRPADSLLVWAWRGGSLVVPEPLRVRNWSESDDAGDSVKVGEKLSLTIADPDGRLGAWKLDDPLSVAGTMLQIIYKVGGAGAMNFGWFRIIRNTPTEVIDSRVIDEYGFNEPDSRLGPHKRRVFITTAAVKLDVVDLTINVDTDRFTAPESPGAGATVLSEFTRLTNDHFPTIVDGGVTDTAVSSRLVFDRERLEACQDLLTRVAARYRMGGDGECHVYPRTSAPVLRIEPGKSLVSVSREQASDGLYNEWIVEGKNQGDGAPVVASVTLEAGPLRHGGPHGRAPYFYASEMITTYAQALAYAGVLRDQFLGSLSVELTVEIPPHPELQAGDRVEVGCPVAAGHVVYIPGDITSIRRQGSPVPSGTALKVACSYSDVVDALSRTEWAAHITAPMPELTWDRMPGTWGSGPAMNWNDLP
jgi:hypothetical protein